MRDLFFQIMHMSMQASIVIAVVLLARLFLKRFPKKYTYLLWIAVGFRLLCPIEFQLEWSLFNVKPINMISEKFTVESVEKLVEPVTQEVFATTLLEPAQSSFLSEADVQTVGNAVDRMQETGTLEGLDHAPQVALSFREIALYFLVALWALGVCIILGRTIYKYMQVRKKLANAKWLSDNIYQSEKINSPFVIGFAKPRIFMPYQVPEEEFAYLVRHEQVHIHQGDYLVKAIAFVAVALHWFNPMVWLAFALFSQDMEMRCDEAVIDQLGSKIKKDYSLSLVSFAMQDKGRAYAVVSLNFSQRNIGGSEVKSRVKNVLKYKKTSKAVATVVVGAVLVVVIICSSNAKAKEVKEVVTNEVEVVQETEEVSSTQDAVFEEEEEVEKPGNIVGEALDELPEGELSEDQVFLRGENGLPESYKIEGENYSEMSPFTEDSPVPFTEKTTEAGPLCTLSQKDIDAAQNDVVLQYKMYFANKGYYTEYQAIGANHHRGFHACDKQGGDNKYSIDAYELEAEGIEDYKEYIHQFYPEAILVDTDYGFYARWDLFLESGELAGYESWEYHADDNFLINLNYFGGKSVG